MASLLALITNKTWAGKQGHSGRPYYIGKLGVELQ